MDIRKTPEALPTTKIFGIDENTPLIKVKESLIFNLVQRKNLESEMLKKVYDEPLISLESKYLQFTKNYLHSYSKLKKICTCVVNYFSYPSCSFSWIQLALLLSK